MAKNTNLGAAKAAKNDEFYTQYADIQTEINAYLDYDSNVFRGKTVLLPCDDLEWSNFTKFFAQNFELLGLKKLISISYAVESKKIKEWQPTLFETESPYYDADKSRTNGKIFLLDEDINNDGRFNINDLHWSYLEGDGDFRSKEVKKLRDEADIIITNPPFSLFREFMAWIVEADKKFIIIGHQNAITYSEVFPLIKEDKIWLGKGFKGGATHFISNYLDYAAANDHQEGMIRVSGVVWFTNIEHGRRHSPMKLMTKNEIFKHSKHKDIRGRKDFLHYINYDAIEIPYTDTIPRDYDGAMGVPISFMDRYCPEQFEILGIDGGDMGSNYGVSANLTKEDCNNLFREHKGFRKGKLCYRNDEGKLEVCYRRVLIRKREL